MSEWQPIETAPKNKTIIDLWAKKWDERTDKFESTRFTNCYFDRDSILWGLQPGYRATHWMSLPEPPK